MSNTKENTEETITTDETMELLGISRTTVTRLVKRGVLEAYKLTTAKNSPLRISRESINRLLERRKQ